MTEVRVILLSVHIQGKVLSIYLLTNFCNFTTLTYSEVQVFNEYSDHVPILFKLHAKSFNNTNLQHEIQNQTIKRKIISTVDLFIDKFL